MRRRRADARPDHRALRQLVVADPRRRPRRRRRPARRAVGRRRRRLLARGPARPRPAAGSSSGASRDGTTVDLTPAPFNVRTHVHEYGGGSYVVAGGTVVFSHFADGRLYRLDPGDETPVAITPEGPFHYADLRSDPGRRRFLAVREDHGAEVEPPGGHRRDRPRRRARAAWSSPTARTSWPRRGSRPTARRSPGSNGTTRTCPGTRRGSARPRSPRTARSARPTSPPAARRSPSSSPSGRPMASCTSSATGPAGGTCTGGSRARGWSRWPRWRPSSPIPPGSSTARATGSCPTARSSRSPGRTAATGSSTSSPGGWSARSTRPSPSSTACGSVPTRSSRWPVRRPRPRWSSRSTRRPSRRPASCAGRRRSRSIRAPSPSRSRSTSPRPTGGSRTRSTTRRRTRRSPAPTGELPPLVVRSHGGPTANASTALDLGIQLLTSRGIAVVDVDYGGSTGYGRAYRKALDGAWGVVDVDDCIAAARFLVDAWRRRPRAARHRGRQRRRLHDARCPGVPGRVRRRHQLVRRRRPREPCRATRTSSSRATTTGWSGRTRRPPTSTASARRSTSSTGSPARCSSCRASTTRSCRPTRPRRSSAALQANGIPHAYLAFEGEGHGFRGATAIRASLEAELSFLGAVFGFTPAGELEPLDARPASTRGATAAPCPPPDRLTDRPARLDRRHGTPRPDRTRHAPAGRRDRAGLRRAADRRRLPDPPGPRRPGARRPRVRARPRTSSPRSSWSPTSSSCCSCRRSCSARASTRRSATSRPTRGRSRCWPSASCCSRRSSSGWSSSALVPDMPLRRGVHARGHRRAAGRGGRDGRAPPARASRRRVVTILEGESLINDASALIAYRLAIVAVTGTFSLVEAGVSFVVVGLGGIVVGVVVGWLVTSAWRRTSDPTLEIVLSLLAPLTAYLSAELLGVSGRPRHGHRRAHRRPQGGPRPLAERPPDGPGRVERADLPDQQLRVHAPRAAAAPRPRGIVGLVGAGAGPARRGGEPGRDRRPGSCGSSPGPTCRGSSARRSGSASRRRRPRSVFVVAWAGMRGAVSLAAALALPLDFPQRDLIMYLAFCVIVATLVGQGLTLPWIIRRLGVVAGRAWTARRSSPARRPSPAALARLDSPGRRVPGPPRAHRPAAGPVRPRGGPRPARPGRRAGRRGPGAARPPGHPAGGRRGPARGHHPAARRRRYRRRGAASHRARPRPGGGPLGRLRRAIRGARGGSRATLPEPTRRFGGATLA